MFVGKLVNVVRERRRKGLILIFWRGWHFNIRQIKLGV